MRILITTGIFPPDIGGPATYVPYIAKQLVRRGHTVGVIAPQDKDVPCPISDPPYRLVRFSHASFLRYLNYLIELWRSITTILGEARHYDVIYINGLDLAATLACAILRKPSVVKVVGDGAWEIAHNRGWTRLNLEKFQKVNNTRFGLLRLLRHTAPRRANDVIVPSTYLSNIVAAWGISKNKIHVVYNALSKPTIYKHPDIPSEMKEGFRLLMVGRMIPLKRMEVVIEALQQLEDTKLIIVGTGPLHEHLVTLVNQLDLESRVFFTGQISHNEVWALLKDFADVLVLNSVHETFPHVLLEAAACGVPVVTTAVGGALEIVEDGETGILIPVDDYHTLLSALRKLQYDIDFRNKLSKNASLVSERFSVDRMLQDTERVLFGAIS